MGEDENDPPPPSLAWLTGSTFIMGMVGGLTRIFMTIPNTTRSHGKDAFMDLLDDREEVEDRRRGLITGKSSLAPSVCASILMKVQSVSNHISVYVRKWDSDSPIKPCQIHSD